MIFFAWPLMVCALIPVIVVEALLVRRWVPLSYEKAFIGIAGANALSTAVGVPLAWLVMFAAQLAIMLPVGLAAERWNWNLDGPAFEVVGTILSSAWIGDEGANLKWIIPGGMALLLIPCFFLSVRIESWVCLRTWKNSIPADVRRAVYRANVASYLLLFILACGCVCFGLYTRKP
jgi:hypothetical protein